MDAEACKDFRMFIVSNDENSSDRTVTTTNPELAAFISAPPPPVKEHSSPVRSQHGAELKEAQNALVEARTETASLLTTMEQLEAQIMGTWRDSLVAHRSAVPKCAREDPPMWVLCPLFFLKSSLLCF